MKTPNPPAAAPIVLRRVTPLPTLLQGRAYVNAAQTDIRQTFEQARARLQKGTK